MEKNPEANPRGIQGIRVTSKTQGASARFTEKLMEKSLQNQLLEQSRVGEGTKDEKNYSRLGARAIRSMAHEESGTPDSKPGALSQLLEKGTGMPGFPYIMLFLVGAKEFVDGLDLLIMGVFITTLITIPVTVAVFFWTRMHTSSYNGGPQAFIQSMGYYVPVVAIEFLPIIKILPATILFVLTIHYREVLRAERMSKIKSVIR